MKQQQQTNREEVVKTKEKQTFSMAIREGGKAVTSAISTIKLSADSLRKTMEARTPRIISGIGYKEIISKHLPSIKMK